MPVGHACVSVYAHVNAACLADMESYVSYCSRFEVGRRLQAFPNILGVTRLMPHEHLADWIEWLLRRQQVMNSLCSQPS